jgi:hypothetical protein
MDTAEQAQNSLYVFHNLCACTGTPLSAQAALPGRIKSSANWSTSWSSGVITSLRSNFPRGGGGADKLRLIEQLFINLIVLQCDQNPENAVAASSFSQMFGGTGLDFHDKAQQLRELTSRLPASIRGDDNYWIERPRKEAGMVISFY